MKQQDRREIEAQLHDEAMPAPGKVPCESWYGDCDKLVPVGTEYCTDCARYREADQAIEDPLYLSGDSDFYDDPYEYEARLDDEEDAQLSDYDDPYDCEDRCDVVIFPGHCIDL